MNPNVIFYMLLTLMLGTFAAGVASLPNTPATASVEQHARDSPAQRYHFTMPASMTDSPAPAWTFQK
jgi:hypothetical protein